MKYPHHHQHRYYEHHTSRHESLESKTSVA